MERTNSPCKNNVTFTAHLSFMAIFMYYCMYTCVSNIWQYSVNILLGSVNVKLNTERCNKFLEFVIGEIFLFYVFSCPILSVPSFEVEAVI